MKPSTRVPDLRPQLRARIGRTRGTRRSHAFYEQEVPIVYAHVTQMRNTLLVDKSVDISGAQGRSDAKPQKPHAARKPPAGAAQ